MTYLFAVLPKGDFGKKKTEKEAKACKYSEKCPHLETLDFYEKLDYYLFILPKYDLEWSLVEKEYVELIKQEPIVTEANAKRIEQLKKELDGFSYSPCPYGKRGKVLQEFMSENFCKKGVKHELCPTYQFIEKKKTA